MKLYLSETSPFARLITTLSIEHNINIDLVWVNPWDNPDELIKLNPFGQVPTLVTNEGEAIYETFIICEYLLGQPKKSVNELMTIAYSKTLLEMIVKHFSMKKFHPEGAVEHPHIARSLSAVKKALAKAPNLDPKSNEFSQLFLGTVLNYFELRFPDLLKECATAETLAQLKQYQLRPSVIKTSPQVLESRPNNTTAL